MKYHMSRCEEEGERSRRYGINQEGKSKALARWTRRNIERNVLEILKVTLNLGEREPSVFNSPTSPDFWREI